MRANVSAVAKTLIFTVVVPGTVAGYVPWRLRQNAAPVTGPEEWVAIAVILIGIAIYLHTAFWGFALLGGGTPAPIAPTKILVVTGLHHCVRNPMYIGVALVIGGQAWLFHSLHIAIYMVCMLLVAHLFVILYEEPTLHKQFGEEYDRYRATVPRWIPNFSKTNHTSNKSSSNKLSFSIRFERARLQPCRNCRKINSGFSPWGNVSFKLSHHPTSARIADFPAPLLL